MKRNSFTLCQLEYMSRGEQIMCSIVVACTRAMRTGNAMLYALRIFGRGNYGKWTRQSVLVRSLLFPRFET